MTVAEIIGLILGSNGCIEVVKYALNRKKAKAELAKTTADAGSVTIESELKLVQLYKEHVQTLIERHEILEKQLEEKIAEHRECEHRIDLLESKYAELQRQFTLFKIQTHK